MKRVAVLVLCVFVLSASNSLQEVAQFSWHDLLELVIVGIVAILGSPVTQFFKKVFKLEDRWALVLTAVVSGLFALFEVWITGAIDFKLITLDNLPSAFFMVFTLSTIFYGLFKNTTGILGQKFLLKPR